MGKLVHGKYYEDKEDALVTLVSYDAVKNKTKYIGITKEYFDKVNGNSYWACRVEHIDLDRTYVFPFQYGYGDQSEHDVKEALNAERKDIVFVKHLKCTKKEVKEWGKAPKENFISDLGYYYCD
jgi:hypothetical protein